jgi:hypothetical protein
LKKKSWIYDFLTIFVVTLVAANVVTVMWNLIFHNSVKVDWETSFRFAIIFGIVFTWMGRRKR